MTTIEVCLREQQWDGGGGAHQLAQQFRQDEEGHAEYALVERSAPFVATEGGENNNMACVMTKQAGQETSGGLTELHRCPVWCFGQKSPIYHRITKRKRCTLVPRCRPSWSKTNLSLLTLCMQLSALEPVQVCILEPFSDLYFSSLKAQPRVINCPLI